MTFFYKRNLFLRKQRLATRYVLGVLALCFLTGIVQAQTGEYLNFDGVDDAITATQQTTVKDNFTIEFWVRPTGTINLPDQATDGYGGLTVQKYAIHPTLLVDEPGHEACAGVSVGTNGICVIEHNYGYIPSLLTWTGTISGWTHIAVVYTNKQPSLYVNCALVATGLTSLQPNVFVTTTNYGGGQYGYFSGDMDDLRIWDKSLSLADILASKNMELNGNEAGLINYYKFNQGVASGTNTGVMTLTDATTSANNGTLNNFALTGSTSNWLAPSPFTIGIPDCPVTPSVTIAASSTTICAGTSVTFTPTPTNGGSSPMYVWKKGSTDVGTGATYATTDLANNDVITCVMTSNLANASPTTATSAGITMVINALPTVAITGLNTAYCKSASAVTLTGTPTGGTFAIDGTSATSFDPSVLTAGSHSVVYTFTDANTCSNSTSQSVTVNALPIVAITGLNAAYCKSASAVTLTGTPTGGIFTIDGTSATSFDPSVLTAGSHSVVYTFTDANTCSNSTTQSVTVNALPIVAITGLNAAYCKSASAVTLTGTPTGGTFKIDNTTATSFDPSVLTAGSHSVVYTFTDANTCSNSTTQAVTVNALPIVAITGLNAAYCKSASAVTLTGTPTGGTFTIDGTAATSFDPSVLTASSHSVVYTFTDANSCSNSTTQAVIVNPTATVNSITNQVIANNSATTAVTFSSPTTGGTIVYNWTNDKPSIGLLASSSGDIAVFTATNTTSAPVIATITVTPSYTNNGITCAGTPTTFTITVNPTATVNPVSNQVATNNLATTAITFSSPTTGGTIVYNWSNNTPSIGLAASGSDNIPSFTAINTTNAPIIATITVTPTYTNGGVTSLGTPITFTITVNPTATMYSVANQALCSSFITAPVAFSSPITGGTIVYNWTNNTPSVGLAASGSGDIAGFTATNTTGAPVVATITVTPSYTNGSVTSDGTPIMFTITVNPTPIVSTPIAGSIYLQGGTTTLSVTASHGVAPYQYNLGGTYQSSNSFTVRTGLYRVTVKDMNGCSATSASLYVPDGTPPITCPPTIRIEFSQLTLNGQAMPDVTGFLTTFIQANDVTYNDRLFNINCGVITGGNLNFNQTLGTDAIFALTRTFSATNTGSIISYQCSQDIYVGAPKLSSVVFPIDQALQCPNSRTEPTDTSINHLTVAGTGYPNISGQLLGEGLIKNLTLTYTDERITNPNGFTIKRTWLAKNVCTNETRTVVQNLRYNTDDFTCPTAVSAIGGKIRREDLKDVSANIRLSNATNDSLNSLINSNYTFDSLLIKKPYHVTPKRPNTDWVNGVTVFDVALISRHILGIAPFTSPYQLIAADVDRNGEVNAADLLQIQRLVLRISNQFVNNNSWRFVVKNYTFLDPTNPFASDFPETLIVPSLTKAVTNGDFVAIKVGDVNQSSGSNSINSQGAFNLLMEDKVLQKNRIYEIPIRLNPSADAFQFALTVDKTAVEIQSISKGNLPDFSDSNLGFFKNEGIVTASWYCNPNQKLMETDTFTMAYLTIKPTQTVRLSQILSINPIYTGAMAYDEKGNSVPVKLSLNNAPKYSEKVTLLPNSPNPFSDVTTISFILPEESVAKVTIYDLLGQVLMSTERTFSKGLNEVVFDAEMNAPVVSGVLIVRVQTEKGRAEQKIILTR